MARILIVEDNPDNLKLFRALLALKGHEVTALPSGDNLLGTILHSQPELVLMDIQLPGKDGYALLEEVRSGPLSSRNVRIVALTAHAREEDEQRALRSGFDGYISKPIDIATFPDLVDRALVKPQGARDGGGT